MKMIRNSWGWAPGTWGELVQGEQNGQRLLLSLPSSRGTFVQASLYPRSSRNPLVVCSHRRWKAQKAVQLLLEYLGETGVQIRLRFKSVLQVGIGNASSSADMFGALRATLRVLKRYVSPVLLCRIASTVEPTNPTIVSGACLFEPDRGLIVGGGRLPKFGVRPLSYGQPVDTIHARNRSPVWKDNERLEFSRILELLRTAIDQGSLRKLADAATRSAFLHADRHSRSDICTAWTESQKIGALGIAVSHSGSSIVALLPPKEMVSHV